MDPESLVLRAQTWLELDDDPETIAEMTALLESSSDELAARFDGRLAFGTAGLRGLQGAGPVRMNRVVVRQTSAGLADYLAATVPGAKERGIVIGYDARNNSDVFATAAAKEFLDRGFAVYLSDDVCPTPMVAFAILDLSAAAGVVVTASHNPPAYNGYKVFWGNGAQIIPPHDEGIASAIENVTLRPEARTIDLDTAIRDGKLRRFGADLERRYRLGARSLMRVPTIARQQPIKIAYTPLHGVGGGPIARLLADNGFDTVVIEPSQAEPDGSFPTVSFPNPEEPGAMDRVLELGEKLGADLILANDPDADRLAVAIPTESGFRRLTGDQTGALLADYLINARDPKAERPALLVTTVVSSQLLEAMANARGAKYRETLTGFKWIANAAIAEKQANNAELVLGYEEALGYCIGELVRDKDGLSAALVFAELCASSLHRGQALVDRLESIYREFGVHLTRQVSLVREGSVGKAEIAATMHAFRQAPPTDIGGFEVTRTEDLSIAKDGLPTTNALVFRLESSHRVIMRPSGTEPKLKCYYEVREPIAPSETAKTAESRAKNALEGLVEAHQAAISDRRRRPLC